MDQPPEHSGTGKRERVIAAFRTAAGRGRGWEPALTAAGAASIFLWTYVTDVLTGYWHGPQPGRVPWEHFGDQSLYLKSAQAFASLQFDPSRHHYPPLYALLAAPFVRVFPADPFVFINVACLAASAALLVALFGHAIGRWPAALCALGFVMLPQLMLETFVVPWTSTLATLLVFLALWRLARLQTARRVSPTASFLFSVPLGLLVPTRPLDAVVAASLYPFWLVGLWRSRGGQAADRPGCGMMRHVMALAAGGLIGPALLVGVDLVIYGRPASPYVRVFGGSGIFSWSTLGEKFVSLYLDSASLYAEPGQVILRRFPWMLAALFAIVLCLALGSLWLRAAALAVALQLAMYAAFDDLLPNGLYRYYNYHYFRWAFWLAFMMMPASAVLVCRRFRARAWIIGMAVAVAVVGLGCLQLRTTESSVPAATNGDRITVLLPARRVDFVDLPGLTADWATAYFPGQDIWLDGRRPPFVHARFLQTATGTRLLFIRPVRAARVQLLAAQWRGTATSAHLGTHTFALGFPRWLSERPAPLSPDVPLRLDGVISDRIFESGFAEFDGRGRTMRSCQAVLALPLPPDAPRYPLHLRLATDAPVVVVVTVDGWGPVANSVEIGPDQPEVTIDIPRAAVSARAMTRLRLSRLGCVAGQEPGRLVVLGASLER